MIIINVMQFGKRNGRTLLNEKSRKGKEIVKRNPY
jgi:hypothetical protein